MTPGNVDFVEVLASMAVWTGGVAAVLLFDERRTEQRWSEHAWLASTREAAILGAFLFGWLYGCPALLIHFVKSRWSLAGFGLGVLFASLLFGANLLVVAAIEVLAVP